MSVSVQSGTDSTCECVLAARERIGTTSAAAKLSTTSYVCLGNISLMDRVGVINVLSVVESRELDRLKLCKAD